MNDLLNHQLCNELRNVINKTDIFIQDEKKNKKFVYLEHMWLMSYMAKERHIMKS